jgi:hypothetical protein
MSDPLLTRDNINGHNINYGTTEEESNIASERAPCQQAEESENVEEITTSFTELKYFLKAMVMNPDSSNEGPMKLEI